MPPPLAMTTAVRNSKAAEAQTTQTSEAKGVINPSKLYMWPHGGPEQHQERGIEGLGCRKGAMRNNGKAKKETSYKGNKKILPSPNRCR